MKHVLLPLDGSTLSEKAIETALNVLESGGRVTLLRVIDMPGEYEEAVTTADAVVPSDEATYDAMIDRAENYLKKHRHTFQKREIAVEMQVETGDPAQAIVRKAKELAVEAVVMSTHGRTGLNRWIKGSVTQAVMRQMPCVVVVVPGME